MKLSDVPWLAVAAHLRGYLHYSQPLPESGQYPVCEWPEDEKMACCINVGMPIDFEIDGRITTRDSVGIAWIDNHITVFRRLAGELA